MLHADAQVVGQLAGVPWHDVNARFRRDYDAALDSVLTAIARREVDRARIAAEADSAMAQLAALELDRPGRGRRPPRAG